jgi:hypothetical protein
MHTNAHDVLKVESIAGLDNGYSTDIQTLVLIVVNGQGF